jgi:hypothetical protein
MVAEKLWPTMDTMTDRRSVEQAVREAISPGQVLHTPSMRRPFTVETLDSRGVVLQLGRGQWSTRLSWECLEGVVPFIRQHGGEVEIGGQHQVDGNPGTLDEHLKGCIKRTTAGWVASLLEQAGVLVIERSRPARVRLADPRAE